MKKITLYMMHQVIISFVKPNDWELHLHEETIWLKESMEELRLTMQHVYIPNTSIDLQLLFL